MHEVELGKAILFILGLFAFAVAAPITCYYLYVRFWLVPSLPKPPPSLRVIDGGVR